MLKQIQWLKKKYAFLKKKKKDIARINFWGLPKSLQMLTAAMKLKDIAPWKKSYDQPRQHIKKQRRYFANKGPSSQSYGFPSSHVCVRVGL